MALVYCPSCGGTHTPDETRCRNCGKPLAGATAEPVRQTDPAFRSATIETGIPVSAAAAEQPDLPAVVERLVQYAASQPPRVEGLPAGVGDAQLRHLDEKVRELTSYLAAKQERSEALTATVQELAAEIGKERDLSDALRRDLAAAEQRARELTALLQPFAAYAAETDADESARRIGDTCLIGCRLMARPGPGPTLGNCRAARKCLEGA